MKTNLIVHLHETRRQLKERIERIEADLSRSNSVLSIDAPDRAGETENDEVLEGLALAARAEIERIDSALDRLARGWDLTCTSCGREIESSRLAAVPHAELCVACAARH